MKITQELQEIMDKYEWNSVKEIDWEIISRYEKLFEKFIEKYFHKLDLDYICRNQNLSEYFIEKHIKKLNLHYVSYRQKLSEEFIKKHFDKLNLKNICKFQKLSEKFIEIHFDKLNLDCICKYQRLSEEFIEKYFDKLNRYNICKYQKLSVKFVEKYFNKVYWEAYNEVNRKISYQQKIKEIKEYCKQYNLEFDEENKCFYAYREHDQCNRGIFNKTIFYKKGIYYEDFHLDMRKDKEYSFGLGIYPKGNIKVKVLIKDWGVEVNRDDGKCRVWGFEIV